MYTYSIQICIVSKNNFEKILNGIIVLLERKKAQLHYCLIKIFWNIVVHYYTAVAVPTQDGQLKWQQTTSIQFTFKMTSILKVLLKQYKSPTGPNKFSRGVTPTNTDQRGLKVEVDMYYFDTNS